MRVLGNDPGWTDKEAGDGEAECVREELYPRLEGADGLGYVEEVE